MPFNFDKNVLFRLPQHGCFENITKFAAPDLSSARQIIAGAMTPRGIALALGTSITDTLQMAPYTMLPRLAPLCLTPGAQLALVGSYVGIEMVAKPAARLMSNWLHQRFASQYAINLQDRWAESSRNKAQLWGRSDLAQACEQQLLDATEHEANLMGHFVRHGTGSLIGIATGLYGLRSLTMMTGASLCLIGITSLVPVVATTLTRHYKTAALVRTSAARQAVMQSVKGFWDNTTIGDTSRCSRWTSSHRRIIQNYAAESWRSERVNFLLYHVEQLPERVIGYAMAASNFSINNFPMARPLLSAAFMENYGTAQAFVMGLSSSSYCFSIIQYIQQKIAVRKEIEQRFFKPVDLRKQIDVAGLQIQKDGVKVCAQTLLDDPAKLREPGLYTVRGANGVGKSTFLTYCRDKLGDDTLFVPAKHHLAFELPPGSSGQTTIALLNKLDQEKARPRVLMLDEWNAHLSRDNEALMLNKLQRWSKTTSVVQVTHHV